MSGFPVGPISQDPNAVMDIPELLRQKRIRDLLNVQRQSSIGDPAPLQPPLTPGGAGQQPAAAPSQGQVAPSAAGSPTPAIPSSPQTPSSAGNVTPPDPSLYQVPPSTEALRAKIQQAPDLGTYHPGKVRQILGGFAGLGRTIQSGDVGQGEAARASVVNAPFNRGQAVYQQQLGNVKALSDIDQSIQKAKQEGQLQAAKIMTEQATADEKRSQKAAEEARARQEEAHRKQLEAETPTSWVEYKQFQIDKEKAGHPDQFDIKFDDSHGVFAVIDKQTGQTKLTRYTDGEDALKLTGDLKELSDAQLALTKGTPEQKAAAQKYIADFNKRHMQQPITLVVPQQGGGGQVISARPGDVLPPGAMTPQQMGQEQVSQDKQIQAERDAKQKMAENYKTAQGLAANPSPTNDAALVMQVMGAIKPDNLQKMRFTKSEQDFLISKTRSAGGDIEALYNKAVGGQNIVLTPKQRTEYLDTIARVAGITAPTGGTSGPAKVEDLRKKYNY